MITCLRLFLTFLKIGAVSFGGGYGMIALIREDCLANGWLTEEELLNFIGIAESTPGPIAVNMATFVGSSQYGVLGAIIATLGVILPSFVIILLVASMLTHVMKYAGVKATLTSIRPVIAGMIIATALTMFLSVVIGISAISDTPSVDFKALIILTLLFGISFGYSKWKKKNLSPVFLVLISAGLGVLFYGI